MARIGGRQRSSVEGGTEETNDLYVQALGRGLTIMGLFDVEHPEWSLDEVSRTTGISSPAAMAASRSRMTDSSMYSLPGP